MRNLLRFLLRYNFPIIFLVLELIALLLLVRINPIPHTRFYSGIQSINGFVYERSYGLRQFLDLKQENEQLAKENSRLRGLLEIQNSLGDDELDGFTYGSDIQAAYEFIPARVINNSVNRQLNYITLNKGALEGIAPDMAVVAPQGIVGVVKNVSAHYSTVIPVLNSQLQVSVILKNTEYFGSLVWDGKDYREAMVNEIPIHVELEKGDILLTSGYSALFPPGEMVGYVKSIEDSRGGSFRNLRIILSTDFKKLSRVYIINYRGKDERKDIEQLEDDQ